MEAHCADARIGNMYAQKSNSSTQWARGSSEGEESVAPTSVLCARTTTLASPSNAVLLLTLYCLRSLTLTVTISGVQQTPPAPCTRHAFTRVRVHAGRDSTRTPLCTTKR